MKTTLFFQAALLLALALAAPGCKRAPKVRVQQTEEETPRMVSTVRVSDPKLESQLVSGFYGIEGNSWRWTAPQFSVVLHPPLGAAQKGATLDLALTVPGVVIESLKAISLGATVDGRPLAPETYTE